MYACSPFIIYTYCAKLHGLYIFICKIKKKKKENIFNSKGITLDLSRIEIIQSLKSPNNKKEVQTLVGFKNYVRSFIPNFFELRVSLRNLLKKDTEWQWTDKESKALNFINDKLTKVSILLFNPNKIITIQIDSLQLV